MNMKVLWITNILFPEGYNLLKGDCESCSSGGWMVSAAEALTKSQRIELFVATVSVHVRSLTLLKGEKTIYYIIPFGRGYDTYNRDYEFYWDKIEKEIQPDIVHIHGTEATHGLAYIRRCGSNKVVLSLQGIISAITPYYNAGLTTKDILRNITFRDIIKQNNLFQAKRYFMLRGKYGIQTIQSVKHIIGRTTWDKAHAWAINPSAQYHFCNETLRDDFYCDEKWKYDNCIKHTIFLSQASYPLKGLHEVIKALPLILREYPDTIINVAGYNITRRNSIKDKIKLSGYGKIILNLIKVNNLKNSVRFLGLLNAKQMKREYLKTNIFICPSSIENSPNSLGEAQILGVPCLASYVGGVPDMIPNNKCGEIYRFSEPEVIAFKVCEIFRTSKNFDNSEMILLASERHNKAINASRTIKIYTEILHDNKV